MFYNFCKNVNLKSQLKHIDSHLLKIETNLVKTTIARFWDSMYLIPYYRILHGFISLNQKMFTQRLDHLLSV